MDIVLSREERVELCLLLDLPQHCFGNLPMMKFYFRKACLKLHPDKGGDQVKMQRLNELWTCFQESIDCLRNGESAGYYAFQVSNPLMWDVETATLEEVMGSNLTPQKLVKGPACKRGREPVKDCRCFTCKFSKQHKDIKKEKKKRCLVWGECFCYWCYLLWFGFPDDWDSFDWWLEIIKKTELSILNIC